MASGFALIGPFATVRLYEMSRRREQGFHATWAEGFYLVHSPALGAILALGLMLMALFPLWLGVAAWGVYALTLGPEPSTSIGSFIRDVLANGWTVIVVGIGVVSFPLRIDRGVRFKTAVRTSVRVVIANPGGMSLWGLVAVGLLFGSIPIFLGLIVLMPGLGHTLPASGTSRSTDADLINRGDMTRQDWNRTRPRQGRLQQKTTGDDDATHIARSLERVAWYHGLLW